MLRGLLRAACFSLLFAGCALAYDNELQLLSRSNIVLEDPGLSPAEWRWVRDRQRLRLAVWQPMSPPYDITTGLNDYGGISADVIGLIARNLMLKVEVIRYENYAAALDALKSGQADIIAQAGQNQQREGLILSRSYSENKPVAAVNIDIPAARPIENIALCDGYDRALLQARYPGAKVKSYSSNRHALEALAFRHLDLFICDATTTQYLISQSNLMNLSLRPLGQPFNTVGFSFAASEQNKEWIQIINKVLKVVPSGVVVDIHRRWNGGIPLSLSEQRPLYTSLERKWMAAHKEIRVAVVAENMPVSWFTPAGQMRGIIADILTALRLRTGFHFKIQPYPDFEAALQAVEEGNSDVVAGTIEESIWQHHLLTTRTWLYNSWVMVGRRQGPPSKQAPRMVVQSALAPARWLGQHEKEQVDVVQSWRAGLERVGKGKSDMMIMPLIVANEWLSAPDYSGLKILGSVDTPPMRFSFGAAETFYPLIAILNKALINIPPEDLHAITRSGSSNELALVSVNPLLAYKNVGIALAAIFAAVFVAGGAYLIGLRRRLRTQTLVAKRAAEANLLKSDFLATMSHEIRTPVSAVNGLLELVLARPQDAEINPQRIQVAFQASQSLLTLIGNILDVSRIEAGKLLIHPERVSLLAIFESVAVLFETQARQKGLEFELEMDSELDAEVLADPLRIRQITSNLLSNAIKFTASGRVLLRVINETTQPAKLVHLRIDVEDTGEGMVPALQRRLFQPFAQDENHRLARQGSGLGLYICRRLVEMMGGEISLRSSPSQGTQATVSLRLPVLAPVSSAEPVQEAILPKQSRSLPVPIVDDNPVSRMLLEHQLTHLGFSVLSFSSAQELLLYLGRCPVSIVMTDCSMPDRDGFELASILRSLFPQIFIVGVTADARDSTLVKAMDAGMNACLFKPVTLERLAECLADSGLQTPEETPQPSFDLPAALLEGEHAHAFLSLQLAALDETLAWLPDYADLPEDSVKSGLHRLRGGIQLLGVADIETLCLRLEQNLVPHEMAELEALLTGLREALVERLQTQSTVLQRNEDVRAS
ncbi:MAG TPA: transporter substrate-binding domain-containing protein [Buttiauxella sp.]|jgi:two-component system sensor histidine kinase EvgS